MVRLDCAKSTLLYSTLLPLLPPSIQTGNNCLLKDEQLDSLRFKKKKKKTKQTSGAYLVTLSSLFLYKSSLIYNVSVKKHLDYILYPRLAAKDGVRCSSTNIFIDK